ncbi:TIGR00303 family protein [Halobacteriales archaeon QS_1_68_17]|nr:MAG: TIGR00303 family protein [Halobacteriales archaeon QS_1_68_17]
MRFFVAAGTTRTARIEGISAAGATPSQMGHTPSADAEILAYGRPVRAPVVPVSPSGCPTPAVVTRAVGEQVGLAPVVIDAGLAEPTAAPTVDVGAEPGRDIREPSPVPAASRAFEAARSVGAALPDEELVVGETVPGGTTTALGVLTALGEPASVSSSLAENPVERKRRIVEEGLAASGLDPGGAAGEPLTAIREVGGPVLATIAGLAVGALESGTAVTLAGGSQLVAAAALVRHAGVDDGMSLATTTFVADDDTADVAGTAADLGLDVTVTDPGFDAVDHPATNAYRRGEAKEGVGMGGALALADRRGASMEVVRERVLAIYDRLLDGAPEDHPATRGTGVESG